MLKSEFEHIWSKAYVGHYITPNCFIDQSLRIYSSKFSCQVGPNKMGFNDFLIISSG